MIDLCVFYLYIWKKGFKMYFYKKLTDSELEEIFNNIEYIEDIRLKKKYNFCQNTLLIIGYGKDFNINLSMDIIGKYIGVPFEIIKHNKGSDEFLFLLNRLKLSNNSLRYTSEATQ